MQECVEYLVHTVGHELSSAEGEVRRSLSGDYSPLYQAAYGLGGLQLYSVRHELVERGDMTPKDFHDRVMQSNLMPIELLRALIKEEPLRRDYRASWKFYGSGLD